MRVPQISLTLATIAILSGLGGATAAPRKLPALGADPARNSVSGLSSGAFMAIQYGVAFSASTIGMGIVAGGPYNCAWVNFGGIYTCMNGSPIGSTSFAAAQGFAALGKIDPVSNLANQKIYMFSGKNDTVVKQTVMNAVLDFFEAAQVPAANIEYVNQLPAGHAFISPSFGNTCPANVAPYIDECPLKSGNYDQPDAILTRIYGPLHPEATKLSSKAVEFDQEEFIPPSMWGTSSMAATGYVYIPAACEKRRPAICAVHVVFHGCKQGWQTVRDDVFDKVGYNKWADTNDIIVLYPQAVASSFINPNGCWDWWGYSGPDFQVQSGIQLSAVHAMVGRLTSTGTITAR